MIRFYIARQRYDAYLVADRLNQAGIRAHVFNEHASSIAAKCRPTSRNRRCGSPTTTMSRARGRC